MLCTDQVMTVAQWRAATAAHERRADAATAGRQTRAAAGLTDPIDDFMFDYYGTRAHRLRRWHPGPGIVLAGSPPHDHWRWYRRFGRGVAVDVATWWQDRGTTMRAIRQLLGAVAGRRAQLGCFGMHEWAMVYRQRDDARRHRLPLRLGRAGTDAVVESHPLVCTHIDAFRFFTPEAAALNATPLTREDQMHMDQPGCLHVSMDLYKWALKLEPVVDSALIMDSFALARRVRTVDMQASPYDVRALGLEPIEVETAAGKAQYARLQASFAQEAAVIRERIMARCDQVSTRMEGHGDG